PAMGRTNTGRRATSHRARAAIEAGTRNRVIYVSWLQIDSVNQQNWFRALWTRLTNDLRSLDDEFETPLQTVLEKQVEPERPGHLRPQYDYTGEKSPVTDVIAILTDNYVSENTGKSNGELARFIDRVRNADPERRVRIFLAPVIPPSWHLWRVREI